MQLMRPLEIFPSFFSDISNTLFGGAVRADLIQAGSALPRERFDQVAREKEKLRSDLEKAEKLKSLMASEVDDHHAAIERRNEYNLR